MIRKVEYLKAECDGCGMELTDPHTDCGDHFPNAVELWEALKDSGWHTPSSTISPLDARVYCPKCWNRMGRNIRECDLRSKHYANTGKENDNG